MIEHYRSIMAVHVIAIISWMAGILYLYRLLIYASEQGRSKPDVFQLLGLMAKRLYAIITLPAMILSWLMGLAMLSMNHELAKTPWFMVKFTCVILMTASTLYAGKLVTRYRQTELPMPSSKTLRFMNEVPTLLMIIIVVMVIVRPFT